MTANQLNFKFRKFKIGDLVKVNKKYETINKTYGVVVELGRTSENPLVKLWNILDSSQ
jgi:small-conductance mechanosensitive channel